MPKTGFRCIYELKDTTAIQDSEITSSDNQEFGNLILLKEKEEQEKYATLEKDFFLLDGSFQEMPDMPEDIAFFSNVMSDENGEFVTNPTLQIDFTENHSSLGIQLYFMDDYPLEINITWYDIYGIQLDQKRFEVNNLLFFARNQVEDFAKVKIVFTKAKPYRYVKVSYIEYGTDLVMGDGGMPVKGASLVEETDRISDRIPVNKLSYKLIDESDDFNVGNITGLHKVIQKRQKMHAYESVNGNEIVIGTFFLDGFKTEKNVTSISAIDYKGILDDYTYTGGKVYEGEEAGPIIEEILKAAQIENFEIDESVAKVKLYGWLKNQTCRKALREVLFACGAVIDSTRTDNIRIYIPGRQIQTQIHRTRKFTTTVSDQEYVSDVAVKYTEYSLSEEVTQIAKGTYDKGTYTIELSTPAQDMTINAGEIIQQTNNYLTFKVEEDETEIIISGKKYNKNDLTVTASLPDVQAGKIRKTKSFTGSLMNGKTAMKRANDILDYLSLQIGLKIKFLNENESPGMWGEVQNSNAKYGNYLAGIENMTTDLTGGFISTADLRGYYKLVSDFYYTGEIIAGEEVGYL